MADIFHGFFRCHSVEVSMTVVLRSGTVVEMVQ